MNNKLTKLEIIFNLRKYNRIINKFSIINEYKVLCIPAFKIIVDEKINNNPNGAIIISDINDLFAANEFRGKETVNKMIKNFISQIKLLIEKNGFKDYNIAKMGDEIYVYIANINNNKMEYIIKSIDKIFIDELTLSSGGSNNLANGFINALEEADKKMNENKTKFKNKRLKRIFGNDYREIINNILELYLNKMRISLEKLSEYDKIVLKDTFKIAMKEFLTDTNGIINEDKIDKSINIFELLKSQYIEEAKKLYGNNNKMIQKHALYNMLLYCHIKGIVSSEIFRKLKYKQVLKNLKKDKNNNEFSIIGFKISGLKPINDICGHEEGNKAIVEALSHFKSTLNENEIKVFSDIISKSNGDSYVITEKLTNEKHQILIALLNNYSNFNSPYNFSILSTNIYGKKENLNNANFIKYIDSLILKIEFSLENQTFIKKIKSIPDMKNAIRGIYNQIISFDDIGFVSFDKNTNKEEIIEIIKKEFENYVNNSSNNKNIEQVDLSSKLLEYNHDYKTFKNINDTNDNVL